MLFSLNICVISLPIYLDLSISSIFIVKLIKLLVSSIEIFISVLLHKLYLYSHYISRSCDSTIYLLFFSNYEILEKTQHYSLKAYSHNWSSDYPALFSFQIYIFLNLILYMLLIITMTLSCSVSLFSHILYQKTRLFPLPSLSETFFSTL